MDFPKKHATKESLLKEAADFAKKNAVLLIAIAAALVTSDTQFTGVCQGGKINFFNFNTKIFGEFRRRRIKWL